MVLNYQKSPGSKFCRRFRRHARKSESCATYVSVTLLAKTELGQLPPDLIWEEQVLKFFVYTPRGEKTSRNLNSIGASESLTSLKSATVMLNFNLSLIFLMKDLSGQISITKKYFLLCQPISRVQIRSISY